MAAEQADPPLAIEFDITVVDGEQGHRLAVRQVEAAHAVLAWCTEHAAAGSVARPEGAEADSGGQPATTDAA